MTNSVGKKSAAVPMDFMEKLGFELSDEVISFYIDGNEIVFGVQVLNEISDCNFTISNSQEHFPLTEEQLRMLKEAGYTDPEGYLLDY